MSEGEAEVDQGNQEQPNVELPQDGVRPVKPWMVFWGTYLLSTVVLGIGICAVFSPGDSSCSEGVGFIAGPIGLLIAGVAYAVYKSRHRSTGN